MHHAFGILKTNEPQKVEILHNGISETSHPSVVNRQGFLTMTGLHF